MKRNSTSRKIRIYKTEKGFFNNKQNAYTDIQTFFGVGMHTYDKKHDSFYYRVPSDELKEKVADRFIERHFGWRTKSDKARIKHAMVYGSCDLSYLQCFYTYGGNSLSGEAYDWCKRKFIKSIY